MSSVFTIYERKGRTEIEFVSVVRCKVVSQCSCDLKLGSPLLRFLVLERPQTRTFVLGLLTDSSTLLTSQLRNQCRRRPRRRSRLTKIQ